jgi:hypothetical protein
LSGALHDIHGQAFARLEVKRMARHPIRPDGHIGTALAAPTCTRSYRHGTPA